MGGLALLMCVQESRATPENTIEIVFTFELVTFGNPLVIGVHAATGECGQLEDSTFRVAAF